MHQLKQQVSNNNYKNQHFSAGFYYSKFLADVFEKTFLTSYIFSLLYLHMYLRTQLVLVAFSPVPLSTLER